MAEYAFRSYTKQQNNNEFNKIKALASDKTNLAFRAAVQTGGMDVKGKLDTKVVKTKTNARLMSQLGLQAKASRKRKTKEEIISGYNKAY